MMRTQVITFPDQEVFCVFPDRPDSLEQAIATLGLEESYPVIVLIGGAIEDRHAVVTQHALQTLTMIAEDLNALVICGGTDMGVMSKIGQFHWRNGHKFPLVGITPEALVTWPGGPRSTDFLWWGQKRWTLAPHYTHFILVPGKAFGDESPWIVGAAAMLSKRHASVTVLINGGDISRKDVDLSVAYGRPVIALGGTGRLANELVGQANRGELISAVPANAADRINQAVRFALSGNERITHLLAADPIRVVT